MKSREAVEPTFCSWNLSCLFLLFSFSCSFSLGTSRNTRLTSGQTHRHVQGFTLSSLADVCGEVRQSSGLKRGLAERVSLMESHCLYQRSLPAASLLQTMNLRFDQIRDTERAGTTLILRPTTKKCNVKVFAKKLLYSQSQKRVVLNGAWCAANVLATFWPSPGPV